LRRERCSGGRDLCLCLRPTSALSDNDVAKAALRVTGLLLLGFLAVVAVERKPWNALKSSTLFLRVRSWAFIAPLFILTLFIGGLVVFLFAAFVGLQGTAEYVRMTGVDRRYALLMGAWIVLGLLIGAFGRRYFLLLPLGFFMALTLIPIMSGQVHGAHRQVSGSFFGYLYIGLPMAYFVFIKAEESWGLEFLLIVGLAVALSDVCAFVVGSILKGPKLAPAVSPGKTWSGTLGNLIGAAAALGLLGVAVPSEWNGLGIAVLVLAVTAGAVWGDLTESFVKRDFAVKDAGTLLPGFGGILDRVDSFLLAMPLSYYALIAANYLGR
jgi:phosphatidate cytidylyltransferase